MPEIGQNVTQLQSQPAKTSITTEVRTSSKNLSFLLDSAIYHTIPQDDIPKPFRRPLPTPPRPQSNGSLLAKVDTLLADGDFAGAAHFSALCLTSPFLDPTDAAFIFELLSVRYTSLELLGQEALAAREARALEDLTSTFYCNVVEADELMIEAHARQRPLSIHIVPFELRVQAMRLQSIAFDDRRRFITALYDVGSECREHIASPYTSAEDRELWRSRLATLGTQVINSLIDLEEFDCAERFMSQHSLEDKSGEPTWACRKMLLLVRMGRVVEAEKYIEDIGDDTSKLIMQAIIATAKDDLDEADALLAQAIESSGQASLSTVVRQSLAVNCLYRGRINDAQRILEQLLMQGSISRSSITTLATIFELRSEHARAQKEFLAEQIATIPLAKTLQNSDLKL